MGTDCEHTSSPHIALLRLPTPPDTQPPAQALSPAARDLERLCTRSGLHLERQVALQLALEAVLQAGQGGRERVRQQQRIASESAVATAGSKFSVISGSVPAAAAAAAPPTEAAAATSSPP